MVEEKPPCAPQDGAGESAVPFSRAESDSPTDNKDLTPARRKRVRISSEQPVAAGGNSERIQYNQGRQPRTSHTLPSRYSESGGSPFGDNFRSHRPENPFRDTRSASPAYAPNQRTASAGYGNRESRAEGGGYQGTPRREDDGRAYSRGDRPVYPHRPLQQRQGNRSASAESDGAKRPYPHAPSGRPGKRFAGSKPKVKNRAPQPVKYQEVIADPNEPIRLNKYLANSGICSRREADQLIERGDVTVNGQVVTTLGARITRQDKVVYKNRDVSIESKVYVLLNKPKNCVTTSDDPQCRRTVMDLVTNACSERIYPVGRLDRNTTGVLLITNDGDLASKLTHPTYEKKKIYHAWLNKPVSEDDMQRIAEGIVLEDGEIHADAISYVKENDPTQVGIEIHSGRNRLVRRIFEHLGYHVTKLDRVYFAGLTKRNLPRGRWRYLNEEEVNHLRMGSFE